MWFLFIYRLFSPQPVLFLIYHFVTSQRKLLQVTPLERHIELIITSLCNASNWWMLKIMRVLTSCFMPEKLNNQLKSIWITVTWTHFLMTENNKPHLQMFYWLRCACSGVRAVIVHSYNSWGSGEWDVWTLSETALSKWGSHHVLASNVNAYIIYLSCPWCTRKWSAASNCQPTPHLVFTSPSFFCLLFAGSLRAGV